MKTKFWIPALIIILLSSCGNRPNPKIWTEKYEQGLYNYLDSSSKESMPDVAKRKEYITFFITRAKEEIPNGLNSVSKDSLHNLNIRIGFEYAKLQYRKGDTTMGVKPYYTPWTPIIEKTFRIDYKALLYNKYPKTTDKFCDCMIEKIRKMYPDSILVPMPKDFNYKISMECNGILVN